MLKLRPDYLKLDCKNYNYKQSSTVKHYSSRLMVATMLVSSSGYIQLAITHQLSNLSPTSRLMYSAIGSLMMVNFY